MTKRRFEEIGKTIGALVEENNEAYGDSFARSQEILKVLFPDGVQPNQYRDMLGMVRVIDKMFRIATDKDAFGESPWKDITGYGILGTAGDEREKEVIESSKGCKAGKKKCGKKCEPSMKQKHLAREYAQAVDGIVKFLVWVGESKQEPAAGNPTAPWDI
jgi:hypothetical protein